MEFFKNKNIKKRVSVGVKAAVAGGCGTLRKAATGRWSTNRTTKAEGWVASEKHLQNSRDGRKDFEIVSVG